MASLLRICDVPDDALRELEARAANSGQSLNSYLLDLIAREVSRPTVAQVLAQMAERPDRSAISSVEALDASRRERDVDLLRLE